MQISELSVFSTPDEDMEQITLDEFKRDIDKLCALPLKPKHYYLWHENNGTTYTHQLTEEEKSYLIDRGFKLNDLKGLIDFNWLELYLPVPFDRIEVHLDTCNNGFVANVYEHSESVSAIWTGTVHNVSNIKERKGTDLIRLCKDMIEEVIPWYQKWADSCKDALSESKENQ